MSAHKKISIVMPVYNVEAYLQEAVESILHQTYSNWELILVDDGSTDSCGSMCDAWAECDERIRAVHTPNGGLSHARNTGMALATGEWILFPDSDDRLNEYTLEILLRNTDGVDVVICIQENDSRIPDNIVAINYTANRQELAQIYTAADIFIQPTRAETFGLVGAEALACGTPVITYRSGGSPEIVDETCGCVEEYGDIDGLILAIEEEVMKRRFKRENCQKRAEKFGVEKMSQDYLDLFVDILSAAKK